MLAPFGSASLSRRNRGARWSTAISRTSSRLSRLSARPAAARASISSTYEAAIEEHAATTADPAAACRAAAALLHDLAVRDRHRERSLWTLAKASQRVLRMPLVGPTATWALRRLIRRR